MTALMVLVVLASGCSGGSDDAAHDGRLVVVDASIDWPANPDVASAQLTIENDTASDDVLVAVTSRDVADASVHRSDTDDSGRSTMERVDRLDVPAGESVVFEAGGLHVMLRDPGPLKVGDDVSLTFEFENAGKRTVRAQVVEPGSTEELESHDE